MMAPKIEAACRFVERTGCSAAIGSLAELEAVISGTAGTQIVSPRVASPLRSSRNRLHRIADGRATSRATFEPRSNDAYRRGRNGARSREARRPTRTGTARRRASRRRPLGRVPLSQPRASVRRSRARGIARPPGGDRPLRPCTGRGLRDVRALPGSAGDPQCADGEVAPDSLAEADRRAAASHRTRRGAAGRGRGSRPDGAASRRCARPPPSVVLEIRGVPGVSVSLDQCVPDGSTLETIVADAGAPDPEVEVIEHEQASSSTQRSPRFRGGSARSSAVTSDSAAHRKRSPRSQRRSISPSSGRVQSSATRSTRWSSSIRLECCAPERQREIFARHFEVTDTEEIADVASALHLSSTRRPRYRRLERDARDALQQLAARRSGRRDRSSRSNAQRPVGQRLPGSPERTAGTSGTQPSASRACSSAQSLVMRGPSDPAVETLARPEGDGP